MSAILSRCILHNQIKCLTIRYNQERGRKVSRRPLKVNLGSQFDKLQHVDDFIETNKMTVEPITKDISEVSSKFYEDNLGEDVLHKFSHSSKNRNKNVKEQESDALKEFKAALKFKTAKQQQINLIQTCKSAKERKSSNLFLAEGKHIIHDALQVGLSPSCILFSDPKTLVDIAPAGYAGFNNPMKAINALPLYRTKYDRLKLWSDLTTCPGLFGIFEIPPVISREKSANTLPLKVICDNIKDPNNLGSIIRTLACFGISNVLITESCHDPWSSKVVRSSSGGIFYLNVYQDVKWTHINKYIDKISNVYVADFCRTPIKSDSLLSSLKPFRNRNSYIENDPAFVDSLYDAIEESKEFEYYEFDNEREYIIDPSFLDSDLMYKFKNYVLQFENYLNIDYFNKKERLDENVLIITGEQGVGIEVKKFSCEYNAMEIGLPTTEDINSLQFSVAMSILLYEMKRQFKSNIK